MFLLEQTARYGISLLSGLSMIDTPAPFFSVDQFVSKFKTFNRVVLNKRKSLYMCYYLLCLLLHCVLCSQSLPRAMYGLSWTGTWLSTPICCEARRERFSVHLILCWDIAYIRKGSASDFVIKTLCGEVKMCSSDTSVRWWTLLAS